MWRQILGHDLGYASSNSLPTVSKRWGTQPPGGNLMLWCLGEKPITYFVHEQSVNHYVKCGIRYSTPPSRWIYYLESRFTVKYSRQIFFFTIKLFFSSNEIDTFQLSFQWKKQCYKWCICMPTDTKLGRAEF